MKKILCLVAGLFLGTANATIIDFEGIAPFGNHTGFDSRSHIEDGFALHVTHGHLISSAFSIGGYNNHNVQNGTDWMMLDNSSSNILSSVDSSLFTMNSFDFMSFSRDGTGTVTGTFADNSIIQASVAYNSTFSTYTFGSAWSGLKSVDFGGRFSSKAIDNIVVNAVGIPEPASIIILGLGLVGLGASRRKK